MTAPGPPASHDDGVVRLPALPHDASDVAVASWRVAPGAVVRCGDPMLDIAGDAPQTVRSPSDGMVRALLADPQQQLVSDQPLWSFWAGAASYPRDSAVVVAPYRAAWPLAFEHLKRHLGRVLKSMPCSIEHVGSTAVRGLNAKPIIDVSVLLDDGRDVSAAIAAIASLGYAHIGDLGVDGREAFDQPAFLPRHNLYVGQRDAASMRNHLVFRDALLADPSLLARYAGLKQRLADAHGDSVARYTAEKTAFITTVLRGSGAFSNEELAAIDRANAATPASGADDA